MTRFCYFLSLLLCLLALSGCNGTESLEPMRVQQANLNTSEQDILWLAEGCDSVHLLDYHVDDTVNTVTAHMYLFTQEAGKWDCIAQASSNLGLTKGRFAVGYDFGVFLSISGTAFSEKFYSEVSDPLEDVFGFASSFRTACFDFPIEAGVEVPISFASIGGNDMSYPEPFTPDMFTAFEDAQYLLDCAVTRAYMVTLSFTDAPLPE